MRDLGELLDCIIVSCGVGIAADYWWPDTHAGPLLAVIGFLATMVWQVRGRKW
jgi:hypothetical protein